MVRSSAQLREVDQNYDFFQRNLSEILPSHMGQFALLKKRSIVAYFNSPGLAYHSGRERFPDGVFSIQEVTDEPIDLGFFSHVEHH